MQKVVILLLITTLITSISACSGIKFPGVYRVNVQQGNYLQQSKLDELEIGMTRTQVQYVMGTPLVKDSFNQDRWDYYFSVKRGSTVFQQKKFSLFFEDNLLARWEGDVKPRTAEEIAEYEAKRKAAKQAKIDENVSTENASKDKINPEIP